MTSITRRLLTLPTLFGLAAGAAFSQQATLFSSGLSNPAKIIIGPSGTLIAAETGSTPNSGRVSLISASGTRTTLLDGLPSGLSAPNGDPDGVNGLLLDGNTLYIAIGEGDLYVSGTVPGTTVVSAKAISSPIFDTLLKLDLPQSADRIVSAFSLKTADHTTLFNGDPVALTNSSGDKATLSVLTEFRFRPDAVEVIKHSHPYGLAKLDSDPNHLYVNDAGLNLVHQIDIASGRKRTLIQFPSFPSVGSTPPPVVDAVPDSVRAYGNQLLVTFLTGFPFTPGDAKVLLVDPATGTSAPFINYLSSAIDIVYRPRPNGARPQFFVLEYSAGFLAGQPGRVQVFNTATPQVLVDGINGPTSLALDATGGKLYIASRTDGKIFQVDVGQ
jgi:hypothetical protein